MPIQNLSKIYEGTSCYSSVDLDAIHETASKPLCGPTKTLTIQAIYSSFSNLHTLSPGAPPLRDPFYSSENKSPYY